MELRVEAASNCTLPPGCFVGVRVGDTLKQGRYEPQRCYNFPNVDRCRNAKIDIYRHVGSCILPVDPEAPAVHGVSVASNDPSLSAINLNVNVQPASGANVAKQKEEKRRKDVTCLAQDYLEKFNIEEKLSMAVKALLKEQPANPTEFLCRHLAEMEKIFVAPSSPVANVGAAPAKPSGQILSSGSFGNYYKAECLPSCNDASFASLYSKFPAAAAARPTAMLQAPVPEDKVAIIKGLVGAATTMMSTNLVCAAGLAMAASEVGQGVPSESATMALAAAKKGSDNAASLIDAALAAVLESSGRTRASP